MLEELKKLYRTQNYSNGQTIAHLADEELIENINNTFKNDIEFLEEIYSKKDKPKKNIITSWHLLFKSITINNLGNRHTKRCRYNIYQFICTGISPYAFIKLPYYKKY